MIGTIIVTDVGQNQVWCMQSFEVKENQRILTSGGHGSMGFSLPAGIGAHYAENKKVICFSRRPDGLQMNIQELEFIKRENIPVKIIVLNNKSLGMIRHFQEMYFDSKYAQTIKNYGYSVPDFCKIANAYGIESLKIEDLDREIEKIRELLENDKPVLLQIEMSENTYVYPKLAVRKTNL